MALKLQTKYKGLDAEYWRINQFRYDDLTDTATVQLWLYGSEASKEENVSENALKREVIVVNGIKEIPTPDESFMVDVTGPRDLLKKMLYQKIVESLLNEEGEEQNPFVNATPC